MCLSVLWVNGEANLVVVMLLEMRADQGNEFQLDVYMSGTEGADEGGSGN